MQDRLFPLKFYLNAALCQSPPDISKTKKAINYIKHFSVISRVNAGSVENGTHHMTVILTNNSLSDTTQWKCRLQKNLKGLNSIILSSNKTSDAKSLDTIFAKMLKAKKADDLPDLLVMCTHEKRTTDLIELITTLKNKTYNFSKFGIHAISLTIMFDEADKNMKLISASLTAIDPLITMVTGNLKSDNVIKDIHFITATPYNTFWKHLTKHNITRLHNINTAIAGMDKDSVLHNSIIELMKDYRPIEDHRIHTENADMTPDPLAYVVAVLDTIPTNKGPLTVFAPSKRYISEHNLMRQELTRRGFHVYIDNSEGKGFFDTTGAFLSLDTFNRGNGVVGELYNTFVKWRSLHPTDHLAITGLTTITRGITFNTTGFNFTDAIISACHMEDISDLVQLFGRANGGKEYVDIMNIHCPPLVFAKVKEQIDMTCAIFNKNPEEFKESQFRKKTKKELQAAASTVPVVIHLTKDEYDSIKKVGRGWNMQTIHSEISKKNPELATTIKEMECFQCTEPEEEKSYKKSITALMAAAKKNENYVVGKYVKDKDGYQIFLDKPKEAEESGGNIIVSLYYGSLINDDSDSK